MKHYTAPIQQYILPPAIIEHTLIVRLDDGTRYEVGCELVKHVHIFWTAVRGSYALLEMLDGRRFELEHNAADVQAVWNAYLADNPRN